MNGPTHYVTAERLLSMASEATTRDDGSGASRYIAAAQVHATLALVAVTRDTGAGVVAPWTEVLA